MQISIIIPTYNRATIIPKTLDSIINQTYKNWECYIVDDHSTDNTKTVIDDYAHKDSRFHYLVNTRKKGAQGARNTGLYHCNSEWVYFFDSDNQLHPDNLEELVKSLSERIDIVQCFSQVLSIDSGERVKLFNWINHGNIHDRILFAETYTDFNQAIIRKSKLIEIGGLDEDCPCMQEWDTHIRLSQISKYNTVEKILVDYYVGADDAISSNPKRDVIGKTYILEKYIDEWQLCPRKLRRYIFYMMTLIHKLPDKQFRIHAYKRLKSFIPEWYLIRGGIMSYMLILKDYFAHLFSRNSKYLSLK